MSNIILPLIIVFVIIYGVFKKVDIYTSFTNGSVESFKMIKSLFPTLLFMIIGINVFLNSGIFNLINIDFIPNELLSLIFTRPISGSSSLIILNDILEKYGPDSFIGILSSVLQGSTDTTIYVITLYFGTIGIKKIRYSMYVGLLSDLCAFIISYIIVYLFLI